MPNINNQSSLIQPLIRIASLAIVLFSVGCGAVLKQGEKGQISSPAFSVQKKGAYYLDDGPEDNPRADLHMIPDAVPRDEPLRAINMRPYVALGKQYTPRTGHKPYKERGVASWYGRRYHGQKTASGEIYDMYGMTAAHPVLPIPSYVRVTNIGNGKSVVVRINDRGPFLSNRLIDLSYTAAYKLDVLGGGSALVQVESILPETAAISPPRRGHPSARPLPPASARAASQEATGRASAFTQEVQDDEGSPDLLKWASAPGGQPDSFPGNVAAPDPKGGIYLQLGAFNAYDSADNLLSRMRAELPARIEPLEIIAKDGLFKVHAGPYPDRVIARQVAEKIAQTLSIKPMLLTR